MRQSNQLYWIRSTIAALSALILSATAASACRPVAGWYNNWVKQPLERKIAQSTVVFVGTVQSVAGGTVRLKVDVPIRGINASEYEVKNGGTDCDVVFGAGQRWLYAGTNLFSGSKELIEMSPNDFQELQRIMSRHLSEMTPQQKRAVRNLMRDWTRHKTPK